MRTKRRLKKDFEKKTNDGPMINLGEILKARHRIQPHIHNTPLMLSETLSTECGANIYVKLESLQKTGAFKVRGIYNKIIKDLEGGVSLNYITASSGNHGLGLASAAKQFGRQAIVVVPIKTPSIKISSLQRHGAKTIVHGKDWNESFEHAQELASKGDFSLIHPFEDDEVINGQGTIALEILESLSAPDYFLASIGGGSMIGANALVFGELSPKTRVIGLQTLGADAMFRSVQGGRLIDLPHITSRIESFATRRVSQKTFDLTKRYVTEILRLNDEDCIEAMLFMLERTHVLLELSASICVAALLKKSFPLKADDNVVLVLCGGNFDLKELAVEIQSRD